MSRFLSHLKQHPYWLAAILPVLIMLGYYIGCHVYPFGNSSLLTVDLGQQYIDFYSYFRQTILGHPDQFLYSFNKALGGDMLGVFAYYLMSPFNFILLFFPKSMLDTGIVALTLLKYGSAGLTMCYYLKKRGLTGWWLPALSISYALSGWMLANQLNIMWLDAVIFLPLVCAALDSIDHHPLRYSLLLALTLIVNYYMGYMICLFLIGYFGFTLVRDWTSVKHGFKRIGQFIWSSLLGGALSAWLLLPTFFQLTQSKGTYTVTKVHWKFEYQPLKILSKFITGSFNFDQMPSGYPNIFVGSVALILAILYFTNKHFSWQERLFSLLWSGFLTISMMFEPLDLLWHGMQFPVWYPYRFSFVVTFWLIMLAGRQLTRMDDGIAIWQLVLLLVVIIGICGYVLVNLDSFGFLTPTQLVITGSAMMLTLIFLSVNSDQSHITPLILFFLLFAEMTLNVVFTLNQLSYVSHSDYHTYTESLRAAAAKIPSSDQDFYRVGKTVLRTKNDAMQIGYNGTDQFNSMFEPAVPAFYGKIGQPAGDGFVAYTSGTLISDALLDIKYWISPRTDGDPLLQHAFLPTVASRPDLNLYTKRGQTSNLTLHQNPYALGIGFVASQNILKTRLFSDAPLANQEMMLNALTGQKAYSVLFSNVALSAPKTKGVSAAKATTGTTYTKKPIAKTATVTYTFKATTNDPYYLTLGSSFTDNLVSLTLNGEAVPIYDTFRDTVVLNVTPKQLNQTQKLTFTLNKSSAWFKDVALYRLDQAAATAEINQLAANPLVVTHHNAHSLSGTVNVRENNQLLMTTIPKAKGWTVTVDGKVVKPRTTVGLFMAVKLAKGQHKVQFTYWPPMLNLGLLISGIAALLTGLISVMSYRPGRHSYHRATRKS
ncbi:YfhO family protein [Lacticaseibacillus saniviri]|uniref:Integral membrane protein n=1 Tax=Lacticaseibacillus saniviri JCM 17471 = DSM 24301 TaxID=1293598 RepID=A0A0R2MYE8_9LACO|nr:YfhO family protein [Lacticaseibacillus saniviri]KRO18549.1 hypothetical protein IV56_GL000826 [Lacticaseibacillus saniviri JCM 17471 = DSM 24301]MCG4281078.1 YfhO family protein [Lacticaseibacillus saniviri]